MIISNVPTLQDIYNSRARKHAGEIMAFMHITSFNLLPPGEDSEPKQLDTETASSPRVVAVINHSTHLIL